MAICRQACPYNTLDGCKVKEYGGVCQLTNTAQPITEYRMTNADRIRAMSDAQLVQMLTIGRGGFSCSKCAESEDCVQNCEGNCLKWLRQPAEEVNNG